jgi:nucleoside phosphorylase
MRGPIDFLILAPLKEERDAIISHLSGLQRLPPDDADVRIYYSGDVPAEFLGGPQASYRVVVTSPLGMGRVEAATATTDAIRRWQPRYVLLVGIAGGDPEEVALGDVLVAEQLVDYEQQKLTDEGAQVRFQNYRADPRLYGAAQHLSGWETKVRGNRPEEGTPCCHFGVVITGDKVQAKEGALKPYKSDWPKLIGVEMEAGGVAAAAWQAPSKPGILMVRGVSDLADAKKGSEPVKKWRAYACDVAAAYAAALLRSGPVPLAPESSAAQTSQNVPMQGGTRPTRGALRKLLIEVLRLDSDLEAFCLDYFPETSRLFSSGMDRETKRNLLLDREDASEIHERLKTSHPRAYAKHAHLAQFEP